jgi:DNA-directed RNA polymerase subunit E'/Rpb7
MESTAFFEKKISISPSEFNEIKKTSIDALVETKAKQQLENKCSEQGFVLPGSIKILSRSMGYFEAARFTGDAIYYVKLEGKIIYPVDGARVVGEVIRKNKMGLYVDYRKAVRIQIPRDLHLGSEEYEAVQIGDMVEVELKRSKFQINDPYILASGLYIATKSENTATVVPEKVLTGEVVVVDNEEEEEEDEDEEGSDQEEEEGSDQEEEEEEEEDNEAEEEEEGSDQEEEE